MTQKNFFLTFATYSVAALLLLMPFHAALVTILGAHVDFKPILQSWKEILIGLILVACLIAWIKNRKLYSFDTTNIVVIALLLFSLALSGLIHTSWSAVIAGIKTNLVVLALFLAVQMVANYFSLQKLPSRTHEPVVV